LILTGLLPVMVTVRLSFLVVILGIPNVSDILVTRPYPGGAHRLGKVLTCAGELVGFRLR
jgi:hypothetical protein